MPRLSLPLIFRWAALCGYALLVGLGHGGWHLALGEASCGSHGSHATPLHSGKATCCHHGHSHTHPVRRTSTPEPVNTPVPHAPHNSHDCAVCAVFAAPLTVTEVVEVAVSEVAAIAAADRVIEIEISTQERLYSPRGPPAV